MNQLIVMPRFIDKVGEWYYFPLGIAYVSASLKRNGFNVFTLNLNNIEGDTHTILKDHIIKHDIDILTTGGLTFQYTAIRDILESAKNIKPDIITIVGGGIITSAPQPAMEALELADYGIIGEGEITNCELSRAIENGEDISFVEGIVYRGEKGYELTKKRSEIDDLDSLPYPDYEGFGFSSIVNKMASMQGINETNALTMISSRSCPYQCTFCFHSSGNKYRTRSLDNFFEELDYLLAQYPIKYIFIADELFAHNMERVREFCRRIKPYNIKWWAQFRVTEVTEELVVLLKESNCATMAFGIESADNAILKSMKKGITIEQTERALKIVHDHNMPIQGGFIFGDVAETIQTATKTLEWWKEHYEYGLTLNFITTYPGTPLYKHALAEGIIRDEVDFIRKGSPTLNVSKLSSEERGWLANQIVMLPQQLTKTPKNVQIIHLDYEGANITFRGNCIFCGHENEWKDVRFFTRNVLLCSECAGKHKVPITDPMVAAIREGIKKHLDSGEKIAFWGINDFFADVTELVTEMKDKNVYFVDASSMKQGSWLSGKQILAPDSIIHEGIKTVFVPAIAYYNDIANQIKISFGAGIKVYSVLELLKYHADDN